MPSRVTVEAATPKCPACDRLLYLRHKQWRCSEHGAQWADFVLAARQAGAIDYRVGQEAVVDGRDR